MKATMLLFELVTFWAVAQLLALLGRPRQLLLMYAWHPLVVWEFAGSGHVDAISIAFIALALLAWQRKSDLGAGFALACATLVKLFPVVLAPAMLKRWRIAPVLATTIIAGYLAYLSVGPAAVLGSLPGYTHEMGLISGQQYYALSLVRKLFGVELSVVTYMIATVFVMGVIALWVLLRGRSEDTLKHALVLATATTVLFAPHFSWYFCWLVLFLCFTPRLSIFYLTIASLLLYATWLGDSPDEMFVINSLIYLPALLIGIVEFFRRRLGLSNVSVTPEVV